MYYIGKIVNTHGIKGEVKIISNIKHKDLIFKKGNIVIIENEKLTINSYRTHKNFDMITLGNLILKAETAVISAISTLIYERENG